MRALGSGYPSVRSLSSSYFREPLFQLRGSMESALSDLKTLEIFGSFLITLLIQFFALILFVELFYFWLITRYFDQMLSVFFPCNLNLSISFLKAVTLILIE